LVNINQMVKKKLFGFIKFKPELKEKRLKAYRQVKSA